MDQPFYDFTVLDEAHRFDFVSEGKKIIHKIVVFQQIDKTNYYNLVLADVTNSQELDVYVVSNNGDMRRILGTVFQCIEVFLKIYSGAIVLFYGSTQERTAIYHWAVSRELSKISMRFTVRGFNGNDFEEFDPVNHYLAFAISIKNG